MYGDFFYIGASETDRMDLSIFELLVRKKAFEKHCGTHSLSIFVVCAMNIQRNFSTSSQHFNSFDSVNERYRSDCETS